MPFEFKLPDIGEGVAEAEIVKWLVRAGDQVVEDQPLVEVLTDKATVEIPSPRTGRVSRLGAQEGEVVPVGSVLVEIEVEPAAVGVTAPPPPPPLAASHAAPSPSAPQAGGGLQQVEAVPAARHLAKERGVDLSSVTGSGPNGRITLDDVKKALEAGGARAGPVGESGTSGREERIPLRGLRRKIAEHMTRAARTVPHFTFVAECDMTAIVEARRAAGERAKAEGVKLTYVAYVVRALAPALVRHSMINARFDEEREEIVLQRDVHVGIATATPDGLVVPVIRHADRKGLFDLAREIERLATGAREKRLALDELTGGTFTVTTTGVKGGLLATPIVHHPQVAILGVHEVKPKPVVKDGAIVARDMTNLSLSLDHRVVDGQLGADFLYEVIANLEDPSRVPLHDAESQ